MNEDLHLTNGILKKACNLLLILIAVSGLTGHAQAPAGNQLTLSVSATVVSDTPVEIITLRNLQVSGEEIKQGIIYISPVTSPYAGLMQLKGEPGKMVRISYLMDDELLEEEGKGKIMINFELSSNHERIQAASSLVYTGELLIRFDHTGTSYLWIGGRIDTGLATHGKYTGSFTIEIEFI